MLYWVALAFAVVEFGLSLVLLGSVADGNSRGFHWAEGFTWVKELGLRYGVAVDSISVWLIVLTAFLGVVAVFAGGGMTERPRLLLGGVAGPRRRHYWRVRLDQFAAVLHLLGSHADPGLLFDR